MSTVIRISDHLAQEAKTRSKVEHRSMTSQLEHWATIGKAQKARKEKVGDLSGVFVHKFKINKQLILLSYTLDGSEINLLTLGSHENFYRDLKRY